MLRKIGGWLILALVIATCLGIFYYSQQFPGGTREAAKWQVRAMTLGYFLYAILVNLRLLGPAPGTDPLFDSDMNKRLNKYTNNALAAAVLFCLTFSNSF